MQSASLESRAVTAALSELKQQLAELADLRRAEKILAWDLTVWMPPSGSEARAAQLSTLESVIHARFADARIGRLLDELEEYGASLPYDSDDACLLRVTRRDWERAQRVPGELVSELARHGAQAYEAWVKARENSDFEAFRPWLERGLELRRRYADCFAPYDDPYDPLLDIYEPGMRTADVRAVFDVLEPELVALVNEHATDEEDAFMRGPFPEERQHRLSRELIERFGFVPTDYRLDRTVHPFMTYSGIRDIRITTRYAEDDLNSLFTAMHECGHGLYQYGVDPALDRTPLETAPTASEFSMALHESQSRLWENVVGRSLPFWRWFYPRVQESFPDVLDGVPIEAFHRAVNRVRRSLIRVDSDETTYGLHIILRFQLEQELLSGRLAVADLPDAWNERFSELLGLDVPDDASGVLQDVHWSDASFGYFPTYQLGNVLSVQIWEKAHEAIADVEEQMERGEFSSLHEWLRDHLYALGRKFTPAETIERVVGGPIDPEPYLRYLREKQELLATA
jgi:carboxypeptidase Taq